MFDVSSSENKILLLNIYVREETHEHKLCIFS